MANIQLHILNASGSLDKHKHLIEGAFKDTLDKLPKTFHPKNVDIIFQDLPSWVVPEIGIVGHTYSENIIDVSVDSQHDLKHSDIVVNLAHELHHATRWREIGYGHTLGEVIVSEGLACLFEEEISGKIPVYSTVKISRDTIAQMIPLLNKSDFDRSAWFFGSSADIPRWFGYTQGYNMCKKYATDHGVKASQLVGIEAGKILEEAKIKNY